MSEGKLKKRIRESMEELSCNSRKIYVISKGKTWDILDEAKQEVFSSDTFPSIIDYPCEDDEARSIYEDKLKKLQAKLKKWLGEP